MGAKVFNFGCKFSSILSAFSPQKFGFFKRQFCDKKKILDRPTASVDVTCTAAESVSVIAVFDIGDYVFYFFRELALESSVYCGKTYYSRVSRICKVF